MKPNVVLIVVDCFRAQSFLGEGSAKIPFLDSLRKKGTAFTQAISTSSTTSPCFASILTGKYSFKHGVRTIGGYALNPNVSTIAKAFKDAGYHTIAEVTGPLLEEVNMGSGFDDYNFRETNQTLYSDWGENLAAKLAASKKPYFLFLHLWDLHRPRYMTKEFNKPKYGKIAYERSVSCMDSYLQKLLSSLDKDTVIVITGDHGEKIPSNKGEEYFNHLCIGFYAVLRRFGLSKKYCERESHGFDVSEDVIKIPLFFKGTVFPKGKVVGQQVGQVDIVPTIADALGLKLDSDVDGKSLVPLTQGKNVEEKPVFIEACGIKIASKESWLEGIRTSKWKYLHGAFNSEIPKQLYDLENDPEEKNNLAQKETSVVGKMRTKLESLKSAKQRKELVGKKLEGADKKKLEERLRKLGYL
ncbi:MAG: hypothetical protein CL943_00620 [Candidatus Diapherotrites archaeon]|uniref:Sulfatase N-terminal domain-containing protein n=1 Tax=Candidatus Iainarchaeum sp. TaxID=3101447 RepID=A0A2D6M039_9ARCH|nr:hypothetical protein [Candidatus Diapherotrites archaeon]|tara:strand:+ start:3085 stop:4323 length:1239 start_codon:yes stop_codon:yes gene_type:complete